MALDLIGGYKLPVAKKATPDVGLVCHMYPGGADGQFGCSASMSGTNAS